MTDRGSRSPQDPALEEILELYSAHLDGELDSEGQARLRRLVEDRPEARSEIRRFRAAVHAARAVGTDTPPAGFRDGILRALAEDATGPGGRRRRPSPRSVRWVVVASGLAAVVLLALVVPRVGRWLPRPETAERSSVARRPEVAPAAPEAKRDVKFGEREAALGKKVEKGGAPEPEPTGDAVARLGHLEPEATPAAEDRGELEALVEPQFAREMESVEEPASDREAASAGGASPEGMARGVEGPRGGKSGPVPAPDSELLDVAPTDGPGTKQTTHPAFVIEYDPDRLPVSRLDAWIAGHAAAPPSRGRLRGLAVVDIGAPGFRAGESGLRARTAQEDRRAAAGRLGALATRKGEEAKIAVEEFRQIVVSSESWDRMIEELGELGIRPVRVARIETPTEPQAGGAEASEKDAQRLPTTSGEPASRPRAEDRDRTSGGGGAAGQESVTIRLFLVPRRDGADAGEGGSRERHE